MEHVLLTHEASITFVCDGKSTKNRLANVTYIKKGDGRFRWHAGLEGLGGKPAARTATPAVVQGSPHFQNNLLWTFFQTNVLAGESTVLSLFLTCVLSRCFRGVPCHTVRGNWLYYVPFFQIGYCITPYAQKNVSVCPNEGSEGQGVSLTP